MNDTIQTIYGMKIIPKYDDKNCLFGNFEGIVIYSTPWGFDRIEIAKMVFKGNKYTIEAVSSVPIEEIFFHEISGKDKAEFLIAKAKFFFKGNEEIAICKDLAAHIMLLDEIFSKKSIN